MAVLKLPPSKATCSLLSKSREKEHRFTLTNIARNVVMPSSDTLQIIVNSIYGSLATVIGIVTVFQGYKTYKMWHKHGTFQGVRSENQGVSLCAFNIQPHCANLTLMFLWTQMSNLAFTFGRPSLMKLHPLDHLMRSSLQQTFHSILAQMLVI